MIRGRAQSAVKVLSTVMVIAAAAGVWHFLPTRTQIYAPFDVYGTTGHPVTGRPLTATVNGARIAPEVTHTSVSGKSNKIRAAGTWFVVDVTLEATAAPVNPLAELVVAGDTYRPDDRFLLEDLGNAGLDPGLPRRGMFAFDVATDLLNRAAPVTLRLATSDPRLDSRLVIAIDENAVRRTGTVEIVRPEFAT